MLHDTDHWRGRANAARLVAEQWSDPVAKEMMLQVAQDYDRIAEYVWQQARALTEKPDPLSRWRRRSLVHRF